MELKKRYVKGGGKRRVAVQLDIETFEKQGAILEDYGLAKMEENDDEILEFSEARAFYGGLERAR